MFCNGFGTYRFGSSNFTNFGGMIFPMIFNLVIFIGLIFLATNILKKYTNKSNNTMAILDEKFANGDISEEEYIKRRTILAQKK